MRIRIIEKDNLGKGTSTIRVEIINDEEEGSKEDKKLLNKEDIIIESEPITR